MFEAGGNQNLFQKAIALHEDLDNWSPPQGIQFVRVAGVGVPTVQALSFMATSTCVIDDPILQNICPQPTVGHAPDLSNWGDSTVAFNSIQSYANTYFIDLFNYNLNNDAPYQHQNILNAPVTQRLLWSLFSQNIPSDKNISLGYPPMISPYFSVFSVHSPADITLSDPQGKKTGVHTSTSTLSLVTQDIPNSTYLESDGVKYIAIAGQDVEKNVTASIQGTGFGEFSFVVEAHDGEKIIHTTTFKNIPVTPLTEATVAFLGDNTYPDTYPTAQINLDIDGDGKVDTVISPKDTEDPLVYLEIIKKTVATFDVSSGVKDRLIKKIDRVEKMFKLGRSKKVLTAIQLWAKNISKISERGDEKKFGKREHLRHKNKLNKEQSDIMSSMVDHLLDLLAALQ